MKITICGSIAFYDEMNKICKELEAIGHQVSLPPFEIENENGEMISVKEYYKIRKTEVDDSSWVWDKKGEAMRLHNNKVAEGEAILVLNYDKNNISNYIGANTLLELGLAFYLNKKLFILNPIPDISYKEEILGMKPVVINGDLKMIR